MFGPNSSSKGYSSNNKSSKDTGRNNILINHPNITGNNNSSNELYLLYQTPIKQIDQIINNPNNKIIILLHFILILINILEIFGLQGKSLIIHY